MKRKHAEVVASILPLALYLLAFIAPDHAPIGSRLAIAGFAAGVAVTIYWTVRVGTDSSISRLEQILWLLIIWFGNYVGILFFLYYRVWLDRSLGVGTVRPRTVAAATAPGVSDDPFDVV